MPSYAVIDSQSVKTMYASDERGFDGGKKVKGRKRHAVSDTMGNLLAVKVHAANIHDTVAGEIVFKAAYAKYPSLKGCAADAGYRKTFVNALKEICIPVDIIEKIVPKIWAVLPIRWIIERSFGWASHSRRLSKDYVISCESAENMFMVSHVATLLRRF
jgi:putative transposase